MTQPDGIIATEDAWVDVICPRCGGVMHPPRVALSRFNGCGPQDVCPECGTDEGLLQAEAAGRASEILGAVAAMREVHPLHGAVRWVYPPAGSEDVE